MQLEALKIFCDVVRWASFSRGASENGMSQSSASQAVQRIEDHLGVKLIDRSKRPLVLTPQGKLFYEGCKELVSRYLEIENQVKAFEADSALVGMVRVASIYSVGLAHMTRYVQTFVRLHPDVDVRLEYLHPTKVVEAVTQGTADLGLISFPKKSSDLVAIPWREEPMVLAVAPTHGLAASEAIEVARLDGEKMVSFDEDLLIRRAIDRFLRRHEVHVEVILEFDNIENIKRAVEIQAGLAILPEPTLSQEVKAGTLVVVRFADATLTRPLAILHRRGHRLDRPAEKFLEWLMGEPPSVESPGTMAAVASS
jgi:DNA-binding transcriptional LysR family regulator